MRFQEAGFAAYLVKPVRPSLLFDAIATAWSGKGNHALITRHTLQSAGSDLVPLLTRVLVAEDNHVNQKVARAMLQRLGCQVDVAGNGRDAVEMSRAVPYDAIFMDCVMPEPDGYETARQIRKDDPLIPIIAMTANAMPGDREHCIAAGMSDYVAKPIRFGQLVDILSRLPSSGSPSA